MLRPTWRNRRRGNANECINAYVFILPELNNDVDAACYMFLIGIVLDGWNWTCWYMLWNRCVGIMLKCHVVVLSCDDCFTSLGICKWYHWHSSGIWPKRTQDWQVQVWVKELDGTWVWSHSRSREAACKYHAMAMWSGCMMQVKVSAVAMLLTLFCDDWRELSSCAVLCCVGSQGIESSSFGLILFFTVTKQCCEHLEWEGTACCKWKTTNIDNQEKMTGLLTK